MNVMVLLMLMTWSMMMDDDAENHANDDQNDDHDEDHDEEYF